MGFPEESVLNIPEILVGDKVAVVKDGTGRNVQLLRKSVASTLSNLSGGVTDPQQLVVDFSLPYSVDNSAAYPTAVKGGVNVFPIPVGSVQSMSSAHTILIPGKVLTDYGDANYNYSQWSAGIGWFQETSDGSLLLLSRGIVSSGTFGLVGEVVGEMVTADTAFIGGSKVALKGGEVWGWANYIPPQATHMKIYLSYCSLPNSTLAGTTGRVILKFVPQGTIKSYSGATFDVKLSGETDSIISYGYFYGLRSN